MRILLLDGHNLLYRAFTSVPSAVTGSDGRPIHGVYGLVSTILRLWRDTGAGHIVAAFDEPDVPTFRHQLYPDYQGQRGPLGGAEAPEFRRQTEIAKQVLPAAGIPALVLGGFEADDILGTLAMETVEAGGDAIIVSTDRDLLQLVRPGVSVLVPGKTPTAIHDDEGVRARLGVSPRGVTTFKALAGDASDNIPGVSGIGAKTAASLVNEFGTLETIYGRLAEVPARVSGRLSAERDRAFLFRDVVTVITNLDLPVSVDALPQPHITAETKVRELIELVRPEGFEPPTFRSAT